MFRRLHRDAAGGATIRPWVAARFTPGIVHAAAAERPAVTRKSQHRLPLRGCPPPRNPITLEFAAGYFIAIHPWGQRNGECRVE